MPHFTSLYYTIAHYTILYNTIPHYTIERRLGSMLLLNAATAPTVMEEPTKEEKCAVDLLVQ